MYVAALAQWLTSLLLNKVQFLAQLWDFCLVDTYSTVFVAAQRQALIRTTKAYATASTDCIPVVAGVLPIDLYI